MSTFAANEAAGAVGGSTPKKSASISPVTLADAKAGAVSLKPRRESLAVP